MDVSILLISIAYNSVGVISKNEDYWIYPNPAQNELTLLWPSSKNYTSIQILDLNGRLVKSVYTSSSPQKISTIRFTNIRKWDLLYLSKQQLMLKWGGGNSSAESLQ